MADNSEPPSISLSEIASDLELIEVYEVTINLEHEAQLMRIKIIERRAHLQIALARWLSIVFIGLNILVFIAVVRLGTMEWFSVKDGLEFDRLVTSEVIMTVIGATTVQLGAIMLAVARHLFPKTTRDAEGL